MQKLTGLLDCNNFYVSCERVFRPDLHHRPVAVLSNNDGCIIARSNEVKAMGVEMGAPFFKVKALLASHNTAIFSTNFSLYGDMSLRVMSILESLAPQVEIYSIDEAFIDFTGVPNPKELALHIREQILKQVGIPTCVGVSLTKTLAKVANRVAKKTPSLQGVCVLSEETVIDRVLDKMNPGDVWGIGRKSAEKLNSSSVQTALQLKKANPKWVRKYFSVVGERIVMELNGISCIQMDDIDEPRKSMQVTRSFSGGITDYEELREKVSCFATRICEKMRHQGLATKNIGVYIRTNKFSPDAPQYRNSGVCQLPFATNDDYTIIKACARILESLYKPGFSYHKAGVTVHDLTEFNPTGPVQLNLFEEQETINPKVNDLMKVMDSLNHKYGKGTLKMAACGVKKENVMQVKQQLKSPAYTTKWEDLPVVV